MTRTTFKIILVAVCISFFSCQKNGDEKLPTDNSSISIDGVLSGKIVNYVANSIDSVKARNTDYVGTSKVLSTGYFSIGLTLPQLEKIGSLSGVMISDTTALGGSATITSYLNSYENGEVIKCNYANDSINKPGMAYSSFVYTDRAFTMKGTHEETYMEGDISETSSTVYNVTFKKGWNEVVTKITSYSSTSNNLTSSVSMTNVITSDLQWYFFKSDYSYIHGELSGRVKAKKIFSFK